MILRTKRLIPEAACALLHHAFDTLGVQTVWCGYYERNIKTVKKTLHHPTLHPSRVLTETAMATHTHDFIHTPVGQALFDALKERLGLTVVAGYLVKNGTGPYEILDLFVDRAKSDPCWEHSLANESWVHDEQHRQIRDVLFEIFAIYGLTPPIERIYDRETGTLISNTCFNISLIDFEYWQKYWSENDR